MDVVICHCGVIAATYHHASSGYARVGVDVIIDELDTIASAGLHTTTSRAGCGVRVYVISIKHGIRGPGKIDPSSGSAGSVVVKLVADQYWAGAVRDVEPTSVSSWTSGGVAVYVTSTDDQVSVVSVYATAIFVCGNAVGQSQPLQGRSDAVVGWSANVKDSPLSLGIQDGRLGGGAWSGPVAGAIATADIHALADIHHLSHAVAALDTSVRALGDADLTTNACIVHRILHGPVTGGPANPNVATGPTWGNAVDRIACLWAGSDLPIQGANQQESRH
jgi:hypothetical protein